MGTISDQTPLVVIVGETASGKSALALEVAKKFNGEIIAADSRTIYKGMDVGTAKPNKTEQKEIKHHLLDVIEPSEKFNVREFKQLATEAIGEINSKGKLPIIAGGTGLYVDAILFDYQFSPPGARRSEINPRHLKYQELTAYEKGLRANTLVIGLAQPKDQSESRIKNRIQGMFKNGLLEEADKLVQEYGWEAPGINTIGYQEFQPYFENKQTLEEVTEQIQRSTILYAKRQRTWFKRNKSIQWVSNSSEAINLATQFLKNYHSF